MDVDQLETFVAIVEARGVTRAASRLHRSQPAVSRRLSLLEAEVGAPLFERVRGGIRLTDVGRSFLPHAEAVLAAIRDGDEAVRDQLGQGGGSASVAIVGTMVDRELAGVLQRFSARPGRAPLKLITTTSGMVSNLVRRGEVALGVRYFADDDAEIVSRTIGHEEMVVVAAPVRARQRRRERTRGVASERWIGFPARALKEDFGRLLRAQLAGAGIADAEIMEIDSLSAQKRLVEVGLGVALLPRSAVSEELDLGTLTVLTAPKVSTSIPVVLVHRRRGYLSPATRELLDLLVAFR